MPPILYEDNHLIALLKPHGMPAQPDLTNDPSIVDFTSQYIQHQRQLSSKPYLALLHRLDRPTAGIILLAKNSKSAARLTEQFKNHTIKKIYLAVTQNIPNPSQQILSHFLKKNPNKNIVKAYKKPAPNAQIATLSYKTIQTNKNLALLEIKPETGRQHQIRVQLSQIQCPILGDIKYSQCAPLPNRCIALLAYQLEFQHPTTQKTITLTATIPNEYPWNLFTII